MVPRNKSLRFPSELQSPVDSGRKYCIENVLPVKLTVKIEKEPALLQNPYYDRSATKSTSETYVHQALHFQGLWWVTAAVSHPKPPGILVSTISQGLRGSHAAAHLCRHVSKHLLCIPGCLPLPGRARTGSSARRSWNPAATALVLREVGGARKVGSPWRQMCCPGRTEGVSIISTELHQLAEILQQNDFELGPRPPAWALDTVGWNVCRNNDNLHINKFAHQRSQIKTKTIIIWFIPLGKK